jgi:hypothetical protein
MTNGKIERFAKEDARDGQESWNPLLPPPPPKKKNIQRKKTREKL